MPVYLLNKKEIYFPSPIFLPELMDCFAVGGDLSIERLLLAYKMEYFHGIVREKKLCGGVPVNALLFFRNEIHISHSMKKYIKKISA